MQSNLRLLDPVAYTQLHHFPLRWRKGHRQFMIRLWKYKLRVAITFRIWCTVEVRFVKLGFVSAKGNAIHCTLVES